MAGLVRSQWTALELERKGRSLFRDPFIHAVFQDLQRHGSGFQNPVVEGAKVEAFAEFHLGALAQFADFVRNTGHEILGISTMDDGRTRVDVRVSDEVGAKSDWVFIMVKRTFGKYEGCIQAHRIVRADSKYLPEI